VVTAHPGLRNATTGPRRICFEGRRGYFWLQCRGLETQAEEADYSARAIGIDAIPCDLPPGGDLRRRATADMCRSVHDTENLDATRAKLMRATLPCARYILRLFIALGLRMARAQLVAKRAQIGTCDRDCDLYAIPQPPAMTAETDGFSGPGNSRIDLREFGKVH
jgi:hypothetical protein